LYRHPANQRGQVDAAAMKCAYCDTPLPASSRRDRQYCSRNCSALASYYRRKAGRLPPTKWRHPALDSPNPLVRAAAFRAKELGEVHGWSPSTVMCAMDGLMLLLVERAPGEPVTVSEVRARTSRATSSVRVAQVLDDLHLLRDDTTPAIRAWIDRCTGELPAGFAADVRAWLLVLLDGDTRTRPRAHSSVYVYYGALRPLLQGWAANCGHLREITTADVRAALEPLRGWPRRTAIAALRSLFRFAKKRRVIFTNPATHLKAEEIDRFLVPMTDDEIRAVEHLAVHPAQRLIIALLAVHAARPGSIQRLTLDDVDLPNRRITMAGHPQRLGEMTDRTLRIWLEHRHATWPHTPNRHVLISGRTALGVQPVSKHYFQRHLRDHGVQPERIRADRILHEALAIGPDPLHLSMVFNLSHTTASRYADIAKQLLDTPAEGVTAPKRTP
jgi:integrase